MGTITSLFVRKVVRAAGQDIDRAAVLRSVGLDPDRQIDVTERITDVAYYDMLETIAAQLDDAVAFPLRVGQSMDADDYGAFGLAWKTAPTLRGSLQRAERYAQLLTSVAAYEVCDTERGAFFRTHRSGTPPSPGRCRPRTRSSPSRSSARPGWLLQVRCRSRCPLR